MLSKEERKAIERIEDFLTTNNIISISNDNTANSEELKAFISKNEYLAIELIATMFLKQSKEIEELKEKNKTMNKRKLEYFNDYELKTIVSQYLEDFLKEIIKKEYISKDKIKAKIEEVKDGTYDAKIVLESLLEKENI